MKSVTDTVKLDWKASKGVVDTCYEFYYEFSLDPEYGISYITDIRLQDSKCKYGTYQCVYAVLY